MTYKIDTDTGCWLWQGSPRDDGYGTAPSGSGFRLAHRAIYERFKGPIPEGATLDHLCRNPICVNPDHLQPVTHALNCRRGANAKLDWDKVRAIRASDETCKVLGGRYGVSIPTISAIRTNRLWREGLEKAW